MSDRPEDCPVPPLARVSARNARTRTAGRTAGTTTHPDATGSETEEVNTYKADDSEKEIVTIQPHEFRLPEVLRHIEAGRIVRVILPEQRPASD